MAVLDDALRPTIVPNAEGAGATPAVVAFATTGEVLVGEPARRRAVTNLERTVRSAARHVGTDWTLELDWRTLRPEHVLAEILVKMRRDAQAFLGEPVDGAVIAAAVAWGEPQRSAVAEAGILAGFSTTRLATAPVMAGLAYGRAHDAEAGHVLVLDAGGGTIDAAVLDVADGVYEVRSVAGDAGIGGDDWDRRVVEWLLRSVQAGMGIDLSGDAAAVERLRDAAERAKRELATVNVATINVPFLVVTGEGPRHLEAEVSRATLEKLTLDLLATCRATIAEVVERSGLRAHALDHVVLVGGAGRAAGFEYLLTSLTGRSPERSAGVDESVVLGTAIHAGVLDGRIRDALLLDVTPHAICVELEDGSTERVIEPDTTVPAARSRVFSPAAEDQTSVEIHVVQGSGEDRHSLCRLRLDDLPTAPGAAAEVDVVVEIDATGAIDVTARHGQSGQEKKVRVTGATIADARRSPPALGLGVRRQPPPAT